MATDPLRLATREYIKASHVQPSLTSNATVFFS